MAQARNTFLSSRMNRDKDARLVPNGEYREGRNININKSEGADVGALENLLGNESIVQNALAILQSNVTSNQILEIIGLFTDDRTSSLYLFLTTFSDGSATQLANNGVDFDCKNYICRVHLSEGEYVFTVLVEGRFLNFSKTHVISGFNVIENLIFWTDNRNQPRRINLDSAMAQPGDSTNPYYYSEDQISVAKYAPIDPILLIKNTGTEWEGSNAIWEPTTNSEANEYLPIHVTAPYFATVSTGTYHQVDFTGATMPGGTPKWTGVGTGPADSTLSQYLTKSSANPYPVIRAINLTQPNQGSTLLYSSSGNHFIPADGNDVTIGVLSGAPNPASGWVQGDLIGFQLKNPAYKSNISYDKEFLKDKFVRFSYRFKYSNNEYSLMAPFTQSVFVPGQFGSITHGDEDSAANSTELQFFENLVTSAGLNIVLPQVEIAKLTTTDDAGNRQVATDTASRYEIKELEILLKLSNDNNVYSIDSIPLREMNDNLVNKTNSTAVYTTKYPLYAQLEYEYKATKPFQVLPERDVIRVNDATPVRALGQEVAGNRVMYGNYLNSHAAPSSLNYQLYIDHKEGSVSNYNETENPPIGAQYNNTIKEYYNSTLKQGRTYQVGIVLADRYGRQSNVILASNTSEGGLTTFDNSTIYAPYSNQGSLTDMLSWFGNTINISFNSTIPSETSQEYYPGLYSNSNPLGWYSYKVVVKQNEQEYYNVYLAGALSGSVIYKNPTTEITYENIYSTSNLSLFGDNINKVPKDVTDVGPTDKIYGSKAQLYYRVYQYQLDNNNKNNNVQFTTPIAYSVNTIQPFNDFGKWTSQTGDIATGIAYPNNGTDFFDPLYNADKNPFVATLDHSQSLGTRIGLAKSNQEAGTPKFSTSLMVAETKPVTSNLDIFWETTTTGLISELNTAVDTGAAPGAPKDITTWRWAWEEQYDYNGGAAPGNYLLQSDITVLTYPSNSVTTDNNYTIRLVDVVSKLGPIEYPMFEYFELYRNSSTTPHTYNIKLKDPDQYFNSNQNANPWNGEFIFTFKLTTHDGSGNVLPPVEVVKGQNYLTNNAPVWVGSYNPTGNLADFISLTAEYKVWTFSIAGKENPRKNYPLFTKGVANSIFNALDWEIDIASIDNVNEWWSEGKVDDAATAYPTMIPRWRRSTNLSNGSFINNASAVRVTINKVRFQTYKSDNTVKTAWQDYVIKPDLQASLGAINSPEGEACTAHPFYDWMIQYPFKIKADGSYFYLELNKDAPPFCPVDFTSTVTNTFLPLGELGNNMYCIFEISLTVKENFPADESFQEESNPADKVMYVRLNR